MTFTVKGKFFKLEFFIFLFGVKILGIKLIIGVRKLNLGQKKINFG
jgi:hypothetical protein